MSSGVLLLDVNLLVALFDPGHVHHEQAHDWFEDNRARGWATCPLTENGFVRVISHPRYPGGPERVEMLVSLLHTFCETRHHHFWPDAVSLTDPALFNAAFLRGYTQITDVYLLGLAKKMGGVLASLDRTIPWKGIVGGHEGLLEVIAPVPD
jgi:toxin-antitoxin system PIN domain toxin